jgi:hypothetical protein
MSYTTRAMDRGRKVSEGSMPCDTLCYAMLSLFLLDIGITMKVDEVESDRWPGSKGHTTGPSLFGRVELCCLCFSC